MRVCIPHMGNIYIPFRTVYEELGIDYVIPAASSQRTLSLGVANSPEMLCLPFKLCLGNFIEALEAGADTLLFTEARGICRLGYYFAIQKQVLKHLGYEFTALTIKEHSFKAVYSLLKTCSPRLSLWRMLRVFRFALAKLKILDELERLSHRIRLREKVRGSTTSIYRRGIKAVDNASTMAELKTVGRDYTEKFLSIETDGIEPLKIGVIGEFFVVLDPFSNLNIEVELGKLGCEVQRTLWLSKWTNFTLFFSALGFSEAKGLHRAAMPYLSRDVGGDGWESVGEKVLRAGSLDGIVHLAPFGCLPEIVATNIMMNIPGVPTLHLTLDEQTGRAGMITRLEAFVDMLRQKKVKV